MGEQWDNFFKGLLDPSSYHDMDGVWDMDVDVDMDIEMNGEWVIWAGQGILMGVVVGDMGQFLKRGVGLEMRGYYAFYQL